MKTSIIINIFTSVVIFVVGLLFISNFIKVPNVFSNSRIIFGIIFMSYGIYRGLNVVSKIKLDKMNKSIEEIRKAKDKLVNK